MTEPVETKYAWGSHYNEDCNHLYVAEHESKGKVGLTLCGWVKGRRNRGLRKDYLVMAIGRGGARPKCFKCVENEGKVKL